MKPDLILLETLLRSEELTSFDRKKLDGYRDMITDGRRQRLKTKEREWALDIAGRYDITLPASATAPASNVQAIRPAAIEAFTPPTPPALDRENLILCPVVPPHRRCEHNRDRGSCGECAAWSLRA